MSERTFPEKSIPYGEKTAMAMQITCSCCGGLAYYPFLTGINRKPPIAAVQHFQNKGWVVGSNPRKDLCNVCARPKRKGKKAMVQTDKPAAEAPREMTREDRRIINDKLDQVYGNEAYKSPWSDAAVAKDLGVARAWVSEVREQFFGPAGSNPLFDEFLAAKSLLDGDVAAVLAAEAALLAAVNAAKDELAKQMAVLRPKLDDLARLGKRIEREIGR